ncbi:hypothetical protein M3Y95_00941700 [Aphelenchoides besseyi]|nr:hypothetical protein M3Y95_00941700 [Aphelenchoides besseyi]
MSRDISIRQSNSEPSNRNMENKRKRICVTGYGSFGGFDVNPAQVIVRNLSKYEFPSNLDVTTEIIEVSYNSANECSTKLCECTKPDFIVHVGVNGYLCDSIEMEKQAFSHGYVSVDVNGKVPLLNRSIVELKNEEPRILKTMLDCESIAKAADNLYPEIEVGTSTNPGRFLCGYIYYLSLAKSNGRAVFIHVSRFSEEATEEMMTETVAHIVRLISKQI